MTPGETIHLSEESLDDILIGLGSLESAAHLGACAQCRAQVEAFRGDMRLFNAASMAWSQSRRPQLQRSTPHRTHTWAVLGSWAAACAVLVVTAFAVWHHRPAPAPNQALIAQPQVVDSEAQIAQDNQLLQAVNAAIGPDDESLINEYKINVESPRSRAKAHSSTRMK